MAQWLTVIAKPTVFLYYYHVAISNSDVPAYQGSFQTLSDEDDSHYLTFQTYNCSLFVQIILKNWLKCHQLMC